MIVIWGRPIKLSNKRYIFLPIYLYFVLYPIIPFLFYLPFAFFFFLIFIIFFYLYLFIYFLFVVNFVIHWNETAMGLHVFPIPIPPPAPSHPSGSSQCTSPEHLSHASSLNWRSVSHLIIYMFWCCSPETSHHRLLPQSPKDCSINLCLFFCYAYRFIINIFLNSIYMC